MASTEEPVVDVEAGKVEEKAPPPPAPAPEAEAVEAPPPEAEVEAPSKVEREAPPPPLATPIDKCIQLDGILRLVVFAASLAAVVVMVTSDQTEVVRVPGLGFQPVKAKFTHSPALIYFVAALSVTGLYSLVTGISSILFLFKPICPKICLLYFVIFDVFILGVAASATGTAGAVGYIGLKGNSHVNWGKICGVYDTFCDHLVSSLSLSLFASIVLVALIKISIISLFKKIAASS